LSASTALARSSARLGISESTRDQLGMNGDSMGSSR